MKYLIVSLSLCSYWAVAVARTDPLDLAGIKSKEVQDELKGLNELVDEFDRFDNEFKKLVDGFLQNRGNDVLQAYPQILADSESLKKRSDSLHRKIKAILDSISMINKLLDEYEFGVLPKLSPKKKREHLLSEYRGQANFMKGSIKMLYLSLGREMDLPAKGLFADINEHVNKTIEPLIVSAEKSLKQTYEDINDLRKLNDTVQREHYKICTMAEEPVAPKAKDKFSGVLSDESSDQSENRKDKAITESDLKELTEDGKLYNKEGDNRLQAYAKCHKMEKSVDKLHEAIIERCETHLNQLKTIPHSVPVKVRISDLQDKMQRLAVETQQLANSVRFTVTSMRAGKPIEENLLGARLSSLSKEDRAKWGTYLLTLAQHLQNIKKCEEESDSLSWKITRLAKKNSDIDEFVDHRVTIMKIKNYIDDLNVKANAYAKDMDEFTNTVLYAEEVESGDENAAEGEQGKISQPVAAVIRSLVSETKSILQTLNQHDEAAAREIRNHEQLNSGLIMVELTETEDSVRSISEKNKQTHNFLTQLSNQADEVTTYRQRFDEICAQAGSTNRQPFIELQDLITEAYRNFMELESKVQRRLGAVNDALKVVIYRLSRIPPDLSIATESKSKISEYFNIVKEETDRLADNTAFILKDFTYLSDQLLQLLNDKITAIDNNLSQLVGGIRSELGMLEESLLNTEGEFNSLENEKQTCNKYIDEATISFDMAFGLTDVFEIMRLYKFGIECMNKIKSNISSMKSVRSRIDLQLESVETGLMEVITKISNFPDEAKEDKASLTNHYNRLKRLYEEFKTSNTWESTVFEASLDKLVGKQERVITLISENSEKSINFVLDELSLLETELQDYKKRLDTADDLERAFNEKAEELIYRTNLMKDVAQNELENYAMNILTRSDDSQNVLRLYDNLLKDSELAVQSLRGAYDHVAETVKESEEISLNIPQIVGLNKKLVEFDAKLDAFGEDINERRQMHAELSQKLEGILAEARRIALPLLKENAAKSTALINDAEERYETAMTRIEELAQVMDDSRGLLEVLNSNDEGNDESQARTVTSIEDDCKFNLNRLNQLTREIETIMKSGSLLLQRAESEMQSISRVPSIELNIVNSNLEALREKKSAVEKRYEGIFAESGEIRKKLRRHLLRGDGNQGLSDDSLPNYNEKFELVEVLLQTIRTYLHNLANIVLKVQMKRDTLYMAAEKIYEGTMLDENVRNIDFSMFELNSVNILTENFDELRAHCQRSFSELRNIMTTIQVDLDKINIPPNETSLKIELIKIDILLTGKEIVKEEDTFHFYIMQFEESHFEVYNTVWHLESEFTKAFEYNLQVSTQKEQLVRDIVDSMEHSIQGIEDTVFELVDQTQSLSAIPFQTDRNTSQGDFDKIIIEKYQRFRDMDALSRQKIKSDIESVRLSSMPAKNKLQEYIFSVKALPFTNSNICRRIILRSEKVKEELQAKLNAIFAQIGNIEYNSYRTSRLLRSQTNVGEFGNAQGRQNRVTYTLNELESYLAEMIKLNEGILAVEEKLQNNLQLVDQLSSGKDISGDHDSDDDEHSSELTRVKFEIRRIKLAEDLRMDSNVIFSKSEIFANDARLTFDDFKEEITKLVELNISQEEYNYKQKSLEISSQFEEINTIYDKVKKIREEIVIGTTKIASESRKVEVEAYNKDRTVLIDIQTHVNEWRAIINRLSKDMLDITLRSDLLNFSLTHLHMHKSLKDATDTVQSAKVEYETILKNIDDVLKQFVRFKGLYETVSKMINSVETAVERLPDMHIFRIRAKTQVAHYKQWLNNNYMYTIKYTDTLSITQSRLELSLSEASGKLESIVSYKCDEYEQVLRTAKMHLISLGIYKKISNGIAKRSSELKDKLASKHADGKRRGDLMSLRLAALNLEIDIDANTKISTLANSQLSKVQLSCDRLLRALDDYTAISPELDSRIVSLRTTAEKLVVESSSEAKSLNSITQNIKLSLYDLRQRYERDWVSTHRKNPDTYIAFIEGECTEVLSWANENITEDSALFSKIKALESSNNSIVESIRNQVPAQGEKDTIIRKLKEKYIQTISLEFDFHFHQVEILKLNEFCESTKHKVKTMLADVTDAGREAAGRLLNMVNNPSIPKPNKYNNLIIRIRSSILNTLNALEIDESKGKLSVLSYHRNMLNIMEQHVERINMFIKEAYRLIQRRAKTNDALIGGPLESPLFSDAITGIMYGNASCATRMNDYAHSLYQQLDHFLSDNHGALASLESQYGAAGDAEGANGDENSASMIYVVKAIRILKHEIRNSSLSDIDDIHALQVKMETILQKRLILFDDRAAFHLKEISSVSDGLKPIFDEVVSVYEEISSRNAQFMTTVRELLTKRFENLSKPTIALDTINEMKKVALLRNEKSEALKSIRYQQSTINKAMYPQIYWETDSDSQITTASLLPYGATLSLTQTPTLKIVSEIVYLYTDQLYVYHDLVTHSPNIKTNGVSENIKMIKDICSILFAAAIRRVNIKSEITSMIMQAQGMTDSCEANIINLKLWIDTTQKKLYDNNSDPETLNRMLSDETRVHETLFDLSDKLDMVKSDMYKTREKCDVLEDNERETFQQEIDSMINHCNELLSKHEGVRKQLANLSALLLSSWSVGITGKNEGIEGLLGIFLDKINVLLGSEITKLFEAYFRSAIDSTAVNNEAHEIVKNIITMNSKLSQSPTDANSEIDENIEMQDTAVRFDKLKSQSMEVSTKQLSLSQKQRNVDATLQSLELLFRKVPEMNKFENRTTTEQINRELTLGRYILDSCNTIKDMINANLQLSEKYLATIKNLLDSHHAGDDQIPSTLQMFNITDQLSYGLSNLNQIEFVYESFSTGEGQIEDQYEAYFEQLNNHPQYLEHMRKIATSDSEILIENYKYATRNFLKLQNAFLDMIHQAIDTQSLCIATIQTSADENVNKNKSKTLEELDTIKKAHSKSRTSLYSSYNTSHTHYCTAWQSINRIKNLTLQGGITTSGSSSDKYFPYTTVLPILFAVIIAIAIAIYCFYRKYETLRKSVGSPTGGSSSREIIYETTIPADAIRDSLSQNMSSPDVATRKFVWATKEIDGLEKFGPNEKQDPSTRNNRNDRV